MIKNIIFDVGNVLLSYNWEDMLMSRCESKEEAIKLGNIIFNNPYWSILDYGTLTREEVIKGYKLIYPEYADDIEWFITHPELMPVKREKVWHEVKCLKEKGYSIYLLSNYSDDLFKSHTKDADFMNYIDGMVVSYQIHMLKPDIRIYKYILDKYNLNPEECIFFDDREENTEGAGKAGIKAITVVSEEQLLEEIAKL